MNHQVFENYETLSHHTALHLVDLLNRKPDALICVASGDTPIGTYRHLVRLIVEEKAARVNQCMFVGLDEWVGMNADDEGSCGNSLYRELFNPLGLRRDQVHCFNGQSVDLPAECLQMDAVIAAHGGLDLILVGVGMNGHIALNEPGTSFDLYAHVSDLEETTKVVGQKYFSKATPLSKGITIGLKHLMEAGEALLIASGARKAPVIRTALRGPVTEQFPASILQRHPNGLVWIDREAAGELR
ncbi:glucosamine-6-phosphate deaminase [Larkinella soli]|uniref:glucosamine-6-phosphate deaminase n=1 Tax=Larkinella soli TaxID=1770527 RepID=UPI000FFB8278|nr:glucosamine-6-phosphate deaminase [Larkinella soli]